MPSTTALLRNRAIVSPGSTVKRQTRDDGAGIDALVDVVDGDPRRQAEQERPFARGHAADLGCRPGMRIEDPPARGLEEGLLQNSTAGIEHAVGGVRADRR